MKALLISLLKFNAVVALALGVWFLLGISTGSFRSRMPTTIALLFFGIAIWCAIGNLRIIIKKRKVIVEAVKDGSVEAAASALDFKDAATERVRRRRQERAVRKSEADQAGGDGS